MGDFDCCQSGGCVYGSDVRVAARRRVQVGLEFLRLDVIEEGDCGTAGSLDQAISIIDALIRRVERWDE